MTRKICLFLIICMSILLFVACSANDETSKKNQDSDSVPSTNETDKDQNNDDYSDHDDNASTSDDKTNQNKKNEITKQIKLEKTSVKQPTDFPTDQKVKSVIKQNEKNRYTIDYETDTNDKIATFIGTKYASANAANKELSQFMDGKDVPANEQTDKDLGHGVKGYGEGAAGHAYFSWGEGNWLLSISSLTKDQMDNPAIAKKMVNYLESHTLPAPKDTGIVYVDYPEGGDTVSVDIRWQEGDMLYQLKTNNVPLDALQIATSVQ
ncbi:MAG TPA: hypothetical protein IAA78_01790 [Candidatus Avamphibacillus intestinigallinarum]|nr:hypothetical protein [Candidatus Avamphibacillus intestinigallinarum]